MSAPLRRPLRLPVMGGGRKPIIYEKPRPQKQSSLDADTSPTVISYHRRMHYIFMGAYALMSALFIIGCAIWIDYRSIFQSGLIGFFHIVTGILIGVYLPSNTIDEWDTPASRTDKEEQQKRREYAVFKKSASSLIVVSIIGMILSSIYLYNLSYILIGICPTLSSEDAAINPTIITLELAYRHRPAGEYYSKRNVLLLRYNTTSQSIIRKTRHVNPNLANYGRWLYSNEIHTMGGSDMDNPPPPPPLCINRTDAMLFTFLENEISHFMFRNLDDRHSSMSIRVNDKYHTGATNEEEEDMDLHLLTTKICRHEHAFVIVVIIFLLLWDLLSIGLIAYATYLIRT